MPHHRVLRSTLLAAAGALTLAPMAVAEPVQTVPSTTPRASAEDLARLMSPDCARLIEAMRSRSASRSARYDDIAPLLREYSARCRDDEADARRRWSERQQRESEQRQAAERAQRAERERAALQEQQCAELLRILRSRRERAAAMNDGERADLARFEQVFRERCLRG